jgi:hypothetical protein
MCTHWDQLSCLVSLPASLWGKRPPSPIQFYLGDVPGHQQAAKVPQCFVLYGRGGGGGTSREPVMMVQRSRPLVAMYLSCLSNCSDGVSGHVAATNTGGGSSPSPRVSHDRIHENLCSQLHGDDSVFVWGGSSDHILRFSFFLCDRKRHWRLKYWRIARLPGTSLLPQ